jgi:hypothetical protein
MVIDTLGKKLFKTIDLRTLFPCSENFTFNKAISHGVSGVVWDNRRLVIFVLLGRKLKTIASFRGKCF